MDNLGNIGTTIWEGVVMEPSSSIIALRLRGYHRTTFEFQGIGLEIKSGSKFDRVIDFRALPKSWGWVNSLGIVSLDNPLYPSEENTVYYLDRRGFEWIIGVGMPSKIDSYYGAKPEKVALVRDFQLEDMFEFCKATGQEAVLVGEPGGVFGLHVGQPMHLVFERGGRSSYEWEKEGRPKGTGAKPQDSHYSGSSFLETIRRIGSEG
jgi:hypothetical protein